MRDDSPTGYLTINDLETAVYVAHLHVFAPTTAQLQHIAIRLENYVAESWTRIVSIISTTTVGPLLREAVWILRQTQMHASVAFIDEVGNHEADAESILTHINVAEFTYPFNSTFPQQDSWRLLFLLCVEKHRMLTMVYINQLPRECTIPPFRKKPPSGSNGRHSAHGCASHHNLR